jgi:hypothetical protein
VASVLVRGLDGIVLLEPSSANSGSDYRRLSCISQAHQATGHEPPTKDGQVRLVFQRIRRALGSAPDQKNPATAFAGPSWCRRHAGDECMTSVAGSASKPWRWKVSASHASHSHPAPVGGATGCP